MNWKFVKVFWTTYHILCFALAIKYMASFSTKQSISRYLGSHKSVIFHGTEGQILLTRLLARKSFGGCETGRVYLLQYCPTWFAQCVHWQRPQQCCGSRISAVMNLNLNIINQDVWKYLIEQIDIECMCKDSLLMTIRQKLDNIHKYEQELHVPAD
jgi:hypothetical protein